MDREILAQAAALMKKRGFVEMIAPDGKLVFVNPKAADKIEEYKSQGYFVVEGE